MDLFTYIKGKPVGELVERFHKALGVYCAICDAEGEILTSAGTREDNRSCVSVPVLLRGKPLGLRVTCGGGRNSEDVAALLAAELESRITLETDMESLCIEITERYEEINLLYDISARVGSILDETRICGLILDELVRVLDLRAGAVLLIAPIGELVLRTAWSSSGLIAPGEHGIPQKPLKELLSGNKTVTLDPRDVEAEPLLARLRGARAACVPIVHTGPDGKPDGLGVIALARSESGDFTSGELKLAASIAAQAGICLRNCRLLKAEQDNQRVQNELEIASAIQKGLFPAAPLRYAGADIAGRCVPAHRVGGDYFDYFPIRHRRIAMVVADVAGHSLGAALMAGAFRSSLRSEAMLGRSVRDLMREMNRLLYDDLVRSELLVAFTYAEYDARTRTLVLGNAGHTPPVVCRNRKATELIDVEGTVLGVDRDASYEQREVRIEPGSALFIYTDGITEAADCDNNLFGVARLLSALETARSGSAEEMVRRVMDATASFSDRAEQSDDKTVLAMKIGR
ncbi:MAG TPA: SpoIIE family protein phosphatase [Candidatus Brocadiia bacterium]|nr:SpoIIE family protein phosphatase [Candidatus Brocadiia bacterium]